jgi:DNA replication protein DnaC
VVFDDLGAENQTDWAAEQLYRVLDARYDAHLPTIITSNAAQSRLDGRLLSRYAEGLVVCRGEDVRRR